MSHLETYTDKDLVAMIAGDALALERTEEEVVRARHRLSRMQAELERRQRKAREEEKRRRRAEPMTVPRWVLELLSAHARKRYQNIATYNCTANYWDALRISTELLGEEVLPRDIKGEHHDSTPSKRSR